MELYSTLEYILTLQKPTEKVTAFQTFYGRYLSGDVSRKITTDPIV